MSTVAPIKLHYNEKQKQDLVNYLAVANKFFYGQEGRLAHIVNSSFERIKGNIKAHLNAGLNLSALVGTYNATAGFFIVVVDAEYTEDGEYHLSVEFLADPGVGSDGNYVTEVL